MFDFLLTGHRGYRARFPENTISSIEGAISCGATAVELDVRATADGVLVLSHDSNLERVSGNPIEVSEVTLEELRAVRFSGERIATLSEAASAVKGRVSLDLDIKIADYAEQMVQTMSTNGDLDRTLFTSFSPDVVSEVKLVSSNCRTGIIEQGAFEDALEAAVELKVESFLPEVADVSRDRVRGAREAGMTVIPWSVDDPAAAVALFDEGVDGVITDDPCALAGSVLGHRRQRTGSR
jgi:glycerophosphoryl diester phosphodiesterase